MFSQSFFSGSVDDTLLGTDEVIRYIGRTSQNVLGPLTTFSWNLNGCLWSAQVGTICLKCLSTYSSREYDNKGNQHRQLEVAFHQTLKVQVYKDIHQAQQ
jgi:hypothetical protein